MDLLLVKMSSLGDVIHTLPLASRLRAGLDCRIHWVVNETLAPLVGQCPDVDRVIPFPRHRFVSGLPDFIKDLRSHRYEMAVDVQGLLKSALVSYWSGSRRRIGLRSSREGASLFYHELVGPAAIQGHAVDRYLEVANYLGLADGRPQFNLALNNNSGGKGKGQKKLVTISPFARWKSKRWPREMFAQVAQMIMENDLAQVIFMGGQEERREMDEIAGLMSQPPVDLVGSTDLKEMARVLSDSDLLLCNDSGPMHLAAAVGCKVVALFGPTCPERTGPYGDTHQVLRNCVDCSPCFRRECKSDFSCLTGIRVEAVYQSIVSALALSHE